MRLIYFEIFQMKTILKKNFSIPRIITYYFGGEKLTLLYCKEKKIPVLRTYMTANWLLFLLTSKSGDKVSLKIHFIWSRQQYLLFLVDFIFFEHFYIYKKIMQKVQKVPTYPPSFCTQLILLLTSCINVVHFFTIDKPILIF